MNKKQLDPDFNFLKWFLIIGLIIAIGNTLGLNLVPLQYFYIGLALFDVILCPVLFLPVFYNSRRKGIITEYFNQISIVSLTKAKKHHFWTMNVIGTIILISYFFLGMKDMILTMAGLSSLILWRMTHFLTTDVLHEYLTSTSR